MYRYFKPIADFSNGSYIYYCQSKRLSDEKVNSIKTPNHSITPNLDYYGTKTRVEFNGSCLKQDSVTFNRGKVVNIYIVCEISKSINISDYPTLENWLFGAVSLTKNADINKYKYSGYWDWISLVLTFFISWYWIRQKCNNFCSRYEFINKD